MIDWQDFGVNLDLQKMYFINLYYLKYLFFRHFYDMSFSYSARNILLKGFMALVKTIDAKNRTRVTALRHSYKKSFYIFRRIPSNLWDTEKLLLFLHKAFRHIHCINQRQWLRGRKKDWPQWRQQNNFIKFTT